MALQWHLFTFVHNNLHPINSTISGDYFLILRANNCLILSLHYGIILYDGKSVSSIFDLGELQKKNQLRFFLFFNFKTQLINVPFDYTTEYLQVRIPHSAEPHHYVELYIMVFVLIS